MLNVIKTTKNPYISTLNRGLTERYSDLLDILPQFGGLVEQTEDLIQPSNVNITLNKDIVWDMNSYKTTRMTFKIQGKPNTVVFKHVATAPTVSFTSEYRKFTSSAKKKVVITKNFRMEGSTAVYTGGEEL